MLCSVSAREIQKVCFLLILKVYSKEAYKPIDCPQKPLLPAKIADSSLNAFEMSLVIPNIGDESRTDISAYWVKGNGLKV